MMMANHSRFKSIRNCLTFECALLFLNSMILSHLSCGLTTWSQANQSVIKSIECLYNQALKILDKKQIRYHHCCNLMKYNILSFAYFIDFHYVKLVFKCLNGLAPQPLCKYIKRLQSCSESSFKWQL